MTQGITITRRVQFSETDMAGIVHFSNFYKWMEDAENQFLKAMDLPLITKEDKTGIIRGFPRVNASCDFKKPLRFDDEYTVTLVVEEVRNHSIKYDFIFRKQPDNEEVASGSMTTVYAKFDTYNHTLQACLLNDNFRQKLGQEQAGVGNN